MTTTAGKLRRAAVLTLGLGVISCRAEAQPLRLRADAVVQTREPSGLLVLQGQDRARPWLDVEAMLGPCVVVEIPDRQAMAA